MARWELNNGRIRCFGKVSVKRYEPMSLAALIQSVDEIENALLRAKANISIFQVVQKKIT